MTTGAPYLFVAIACVLGVGAYGCNEQESSVTAVEGPRGQILCEPSCVGVSVTPDGGTLVVPVSSTGNEAEFLATNTSGLTQTYTFSCTASGPFSCVSVMPQQATVAAGDNTGVTVTFTAGPFSNRGTVKLFASGGGADSGYYKVFSQ